MKEFFAAESADPDHGTMAPAVLVDYEQFIVRDEIVARAQDVATVAGRDEIARIVVSTIVV
jgi:hypothetical protein